MTSVPVRSKLGYLLQIAANALPPSARALRRLQHSRTVLLGILLFGLVVVAAVFPDQIAHYEPLAASFGRAFLPPLSRVEGEFYLMGTDYIGRDIFSRVIYGARSSLLVAVSVVSISGIVGVAVGLTAAFFGGFIDRISMRLVDVQLAFPPLLLAITIMSILGPGMKNVIIVLCFTGWATYARLARGEVLAIREREFVLAARAIGTSPGRIILRHLLPNTTPTMIVAATLEFARVIVIESSLSFLGLGILPPKPSWGMMLSDGRDYLLDAWWLSTFPGIAILVVALSVNLVGDGLRDVLDPKTVVR